MNHNQMEYNSRSKKHHTARLNINYKTSDYKAHYWKRLNKASLYKTMKLKNNNPIWAQYDSKTAFEAPLATLCGYVSSIPLHPPWLFNCHNPTRKP